MLTNQQATIAPGTTTAAATIGAAVTMESDENAAADLLLVRFEDEPSQQGTIVHPLNEAFPASPSVPTDLKSVSSVNGLTQKRHGKNRDLEIRAAAHLM